MRKTIVLTGAVLLAASGLQAGELKLKYDRPAKYFEEALVIGNGTLFHCGQKYILAVFADLGFVCMDF